jgi:hypothetical protein
MSNRTIRDLLSLGMMAGLMFVIFYVSLGFVYKIFIAVFVFLMIFLLGFADEAIKQIENRKF